MPPPREVVARGFATGSHELFGDLCGPNRQSGGRSLLVAAPLDDSPAPPSPRVPRASSAASIRGRPPASPRERPASRTPQRHPLPSQAAARRAANIEHVAGQECVTTHDESSASNPGPKAQKPTRRRRRADSRGGTQTKRRRSSAPSGAEAALRDEGTPIPFDERTLVPRWSRLRFSDFEPFLHLDRFVEPAWSESYLQYQLEFFHACAPRELWRNEPERHPRKPDLPTLASEIVRFQPDKDALATAIPPLHAARNRPSLSDKAMRKLQGMAHVLAWFLDLSDVFVDEVFGFAQTAPPAVYALSASFQRHVGSGHVTDAVDPEKSASLRPFQTAKRSSGTPQPSCTST